MTPSLRDAGMGGLWLFVTWLVLWSAFRLCKRAFPGQAFTSNILVTTALAVANIHASLMIAGAVGLFHKWSAWLAAILIANFFFVAGKRLDQQECCTGDSVERIGTKRVSCKQSDTSYSQAVSLAVWWVLGSAYLGHVVVNGLLAFPRDWDTLMYHLPFIDFWIQSGSLTSMQSARWSTPASGELIGAWFVLPFSGDFLAPLTNLPIFILFASATIDLSRRLGLTGIWPHLIAIACLATHVTIRQSVDVSNDAAVAAFFLSGLVFALRYFGGGSIADACLFGTCLGVLCGIKYFALGYATVLLGMWVMLCVYQWRVSFGHQVLAAALTLLSGSYWYIRNWVMTGFPLYPKGSPDMAERILYKELSKTTLFGNGDPSVPGLLIDAIWKKAGPLHLAAMASIPTMVLASVLLLMTGLRDQKSGDRRAADLPTWFVQAVFIAGMLACGCVWGITPMLVEDQPGTLNHLRWGYGPVRYGVTFLSMTIIASFLVSQRLLYRGISRASMPLALITSVALAAHLYLLAAGVVRFDLVTACLTGANVGLWSFLVCILTARFPRSRIALVPLGFLLILAGIAFLSDRWHRGFAEHYDQYDNTHAYTETEATPQRIVALTNRVYPFVGACRQNPVVQPMLYYGTDAVATSCEMFDADLIVTRVDNNKILARYRPSWKELAQDPRFEKIESGSPRLRLFRYVGSPNLEHPDSLEKTIAPVLGSVD